MKKRLFSILLACVMVLSLMPVTASAADVIDYITVIKLTEPVVGEKPDKTVMASYRDNSKGENPRLKVSQVVWDGVFDKNGCFTYGQSYTVKMTIDIKDGYDVKFGSTLQKYKGQTTDRVRINNDASKLMSCSDKRAIISYTWAPASGSASSNSSSEIRNVTYVNIINLTEPVVGAKPDFTANTTQIDINGADNIVSTKVDEVEWVGKFDDRDVFLAGEPYTVNITVVLKDDTTSYFDSSLKKGLTSKQTRINGDNATITKYSKDEIVISYTWGPSEEDKKSDPFKVSVVTITGLDEPVVGEKPDLTAQAVKRSTGSPSDIHTKVESVTWTGMFDNTDTFLAGEPYTVDIEVVMKDGENAVFASPLKKGLTSTNTLINGAHATVKSVSEDRLVISYTWGPSEEDKKSDPFKVSTVTITGLDEPVVGEKPDLTAQAVKRSTGTPSGIHTKVESVTWTGMFDDTDTFLPGEPYTVDIEVVMKDGENAIFASPLKKGLTSTNTLINGAHATVKSVSEDRLVISYTWGPSEEPAASAPTKPATPAKPSIPATGTAYASTQTVSIDGKPVILQAYALKDANGNLTNYVKLRDIAYALNGTAAQFAVGWDGNVNILTKQSYAVTGSEMKTPYSGNRPYTLPTAATNINGSSADLVAIVLQDNAGGGYTYYQLRDLGRTLGFNVGWTQETGIFIDTSKPYGN